MSDKFEKIITRKPGTSWADAITELHRRREAAQQMGGKKNVERQHANGKLTVRERINLLLDKDTFFEAGGLMGRGEYDENGDMIGFTPAGMVSGFGEIDGRPVTIAGEDFTVRGSSPIGIEKWRSYFVSPMSYQYGIPMVQLLDGAGANVADTLNRGRTIADTGASGATGVRWWNAAVMERVPVVSALLGPCAGHTAGDSMYCHFSVMVKGIAQVFPAGPPLVDRALSKQITKEDLGGSELHVRKTGVVDNEADSEEDAFRQVREFLSYMPNNTHEVPARKDMGDDPNRREEELLNIVPIERKKSYNMYKVIRLIVDKGQFFEMRKYYGGGIITVLARMGGYVVGIIASNPMVDAGAINAHAAQKMARFATLCNFFNIPVVLMTDTPGFMIGPEAEKMATVRYGVAAIFAGSNTTVPKVNVLIRKSYGMAGSAFFSFGGNPCLMPLFAWPSAELGAIPIEGGAAASYKSEIAAAPDPEAKLKQIEAQLISLRSPFRNAEAGEVTDVIDPRDTRRVICRLVNYSQPYLRAHAMKDKPFVRPV
ncbi:MAG: carboxyl transferase domain-containing protein [Dehalococcoidales bacterium]|nr:carboxyl transferase domain-containing protein [Dehalococcoidales bacterium]